VTEGADVTAYSEEPEAEMSTVDKQSGQKEDYSSQNSRDK
jgi:hypothetical protein